jgi:two-component system sensor histidine kinase TctE
MSFFLKYIGWLIGPLVFLWLASTSLSEFLVGRAIDTPFDEQLADLARELAREVRADAGGQVMVTPAVLQLLRVDRYDRTAFAIRAQDGGIVAGDPAMPPTVAGAATPYVQPALLRDEPVHVATLTIAHPARANERLTVQVSETLNKRNRLVARLRTESVLPQLLVLTGAILFVAYSLVFVVSPMRRLKASIDRRGSTDLAALDPEAAPRELRSLIESINGLMARLASSIDAQRRFIADAAHQLRTPLAGLKSQTELALFEDDPVAIRRSLMRLAAGTERATALANRLLTLARAGSPLAARNAINDHLPSAIERRQDLGFEGAAAGGGLVVRGDALLLHELLSNLLDNAIRYTPEGGVITVDVRRGEDGAATLSVVDTGPGVPVKDRERVFEPFYRGSEAVAPGTGLGLAIVRTIALAHGASVSLAPGAGDDGLRVAVTFAGAMPLAA